DLTGHVKRGGRVIGICGGYQMLGRTVADPLGLEGAPMTVDGLGLLEVDTVMAREKTVRNSHAYSVDYDVPLSGYEIHLGVTEGADRMRAPVAIDGRPDGAGSADGRIVGTYLHGLFSSDAYRRRLLESFGISGGGVDYRAIVDAALDDLADELERCLSKDWLDSFMA
ncbi:MAG: cobyric acid synthase CobQ, partial [Rhizobium sp.]|nr:cobyric acid synthase CobQ [Rhizobium sp.]